MVRLGAVRRGMVRFGEAVKAGWARRGTAWRGAVRQGGRGW